MSGKINIHEGLHLCSNKGLPIPLSNKQCQSQMSCQIQFELACCEIVKNLWQILSTRHLLCWSVEMDKHYISVISAILEHVSWLCLPLRKMNIFISLTNMIPILYACICERFQTSKIPKLHWFLCDSPYGQKNPSYTICKYVLPKWQIIKAWTYSSVEILMKNKPVLWCLDSLVLACLPFFKFPGSV